MRELQWGASLKGQICPLFGDRENVSKIPRRREYTKIVGKLKSLLRTGASSGAQDFRTIAGIPSGPLDLEVLSCRRVIQTLRVENLIGGIEIMDVG